MSPAHHICGLLQYLHFTDFLFTYFSERVKFSHYNQLILKFLSFGVNVDSPTGTRMEQRYFQHRKSTFTGKNV